MAFTVNFPTDRDIAVIQWDLEGQDIIEMYLLRDIFSFDKKDKSVVANQLVEFLSDKKELMEANDKTTIYSTISNDLDKIDTTTIKELLKKYSNKLDSSDFSYSVKDGNIDFSSGKSKVYFIPTLEIKDLSENSIAKETGFGERSPVFEATTLDYMEGMPLPEKIQRAVKEELVEAIPKVADIDLRETKKREELSGFRMKMGFNTIDIVKQYFNRAYLFGKEGPTKVVELDKIIEVGGKRAKEILENPEEIPQEIYSEIIFQLAPFLNNMNKSYSFNIEGQYAVEVSAKDGYIEIFKMTIEIQDKGDIRYTRMPKYYTESRGFERLEPSFIQQMSEELNDGKGYELDFKGKDKTEYLNALINNEEFDKFRSAILEMYMDIYENYTQLKELLERNA